MSTVVLRAENIGKKYHIGSRREQYSTLREAMVRAAKRPIERIRHPGAAGHRSEELWALRDVSFEIEQGQSVGIIGRNGAGKSTLLKILSSITELSEGRLGILGRVGSLLEVGTGFHPELTGRENIWLNAAILGMTRGEVRGRFDDIVEFAEISRFLDTPVKRYSSGMYVRLAFAVAAHLEPEILVVDEVLAVGDAAFQKKCLGKMESVADTGRTVLFVSHNMQAIRSLCTRVVLIEGGRLVKDGDTETVVRAYLEGAATHQSSLEWVDGEGPGDSDARLVALRILDEDGEPSATVRSGRLFLVQMDFDVGRLDDALCVGFDVVQADGSVVFRSYQTDSAPDDWPPIRLGRNRLECVVPAFLFNQGMYYIMARVSLHFIRWIVDGDTASVAIEVHRDPGASPYMASKRPGAIAPILTWRSGGDA